ncbi:MAG: NAD(P)H-dependent glycerol-3-phosphate dehydrogenase [Sediminibacterium sp.]|jgi:glycerol-3-phosphate dehydrogenase (NAD(P)+)|uniref:NAD(P)H-dependent glycerol-3-phosphate dehydrogenase n=1 Tax=Sediminibacterium sp. TaxID=1917865 RepID=UPI002ABAD060|nr:NAD(P)H-dependent glycerol-3-phosphate dehydrogenase [Sediminibacterium sp.]MDZ4072006.1 NAD(P)H-dependent glycerol-3-phosphate dehydrogenase [Sediminibacterium sp.]
MRYGIIGSGSWATALAKILTDNGNNIYWWVRNAETIQYIEKRKHNPHYLSAAYFNPSQLVLSNHLKDVVQAVDALVIAVPSAFAEQVFEQLQPEDLQGKKIISAIKGILPTDNRLLHEYLFTHFQFPVENYFALLGPCHAEEVASEKLSYLTFSGKDSTTTQQIATDFGTEYINTVVNNDVVGVQYAAVLKNIYALGAGIAHGLEYGDNFLSVYIANSANEMVAFLRKLNEKEGVETEKGHNYAASVYLGDLLVTCYSLYSRNRTFGNMIGKGYSVKAAQLELNMVAEGYNAAKCIYRTNQSVKAIMPIASAIYEILWEHHSAADGFKKIEGFLV